MKSANPYILIIVLITAISAAFAAKPAGKSPQGSELIARGNNQFTLDIYRRLATGQDNLFLSPYSISTALAMTYLGSEGRTATQMAATLHYPTDRNDASSEPFQPLDRDQFSGLLGAMNKDLNARGKEGNYELAVANALWPQKGYKFLDKYIRLVQSDFDAGLTELDYALQAEKSRLTINSWVEEKTNDKIKDLIPKGMLNAMVRLVLTNAVYFKGDWNEQFEPKETKDAPFTLIDGKTATAAMMNQTKDFRYAETGALQILDLPYVGNELSMIVLLPKAQNGLPDIQESLTIEKLHNSLASLRKRKVAVSLPKFKITSKFSLASVLQPMGMTDAFSRNADFSGMTGSKDLFISAVVHKAYVDVNEEGTEAAAATGVTMKLLSIPAPPARFIADHPFMFLIRDNKTGSILFIGRVMNPATASV